MLSNFVTLKTNACLFFNQHHKIPQPALECGRLPRGIWSQGGVLPRVIPSRRPYPYRYAFQSMLKTLALFFITAVAEIVGCYLPYLWFKEGKHIWLLIPAALSLALFVWLLSLHPTATGRVYAAYGGVYIFVAILWLWAVDGVRPTVWDMAGASIAMTGMAIIIFAPKNA